MSTSTYSGAPWPHFDEDQIEAAASVLRSGRVNYWTGTEGREFETEFGRITGLAHAIFVANGTAALELALRALNLSPGADVVTTPRTFIASSGAIVAAGLQPVFADVDRDSGNITRETIERALTEKTEAVLVVHLGGWPAEMKEIRALCDTRGLALIEDCAQAHGAKIDGAHVGTFGDVAAWSFCQDKIISTGGEGGMVATNDGAIWQRMWSYKDHGKSYAAVYATDSPPGFRWLHESFGTNWRGTEVQAAIGRIQYRNLPEWHRQRTTNALTLAGRLSGVPGLRVPLPSRHDTHAFYRLYAYVDSELLRPGWNRDRIIGELETRHRIPAFSGSCSEIYREQAFIRKGLAPAYPLPVAELMTQESLAFLVHPGLTETDMNVVADSVALVMAEAVGSDYECAEEFSVRDPQMQGAPRGAMQDSDMHARSLITGRNDEIWRPVKLGNTVDSPALSPSGLSQDQSSRSAEGPDQ